MQDINKVITKYLGVNYKFKGNSINDGLDCINLCSLVAAEFGTKIPNINHSFCNEDNYPTMFNNVREDKSLWVECEPKAHTLCVFKINGIIRHVGYMLNNNDFIHIMQGSRVTVDRLDSIQWARRLVGCYTYIGLKDNL